MRQIDGVAHRVQVQVESLAHQRIAELVAARTQVVLVPVGDVRPGGHELHDARHHGLAVLRFDDVDHMVVGVRLVFDEDLAYHADAHLAWLVLQRQRVEGLDDLLEQRLVRQVALADEPARGLGMAVMLDGLAHDGVPRLVQLVRTALRHLVWAHAVQAFHQQVSDDQRLDGAVQQRRRRGEAGVVLDALRGDGDDRDLRVSGVDQRLADQSEVVGRTAHAAGLRDGERGVVRIVLAFQDRVDELSDHHDGRVAGVVVDVFEAGLHVFAAGVLEDVELVAAGADDGFHQREVDRAHLRGDDGVVLPHALAERDAVRVFRHGGRVVRGFAVFVAFADAVFGGAARCVLDRLGEFRIGLHDGVEHDLASRGGRVGSGLAESALPGRRVRLPFGGLELGLGLRELALRRFEPGLGFGHRGGVRGIRRFRGISRSGRGGSALVAFALLNGRLERAQTDLRRAEVGDLVDLQHGVHVGLVGEDFADLVGGDGVEAASEGVELHEFESRIGGDEVGRRVQARVVGPLVGDAQRHLGDLAVVDVAEPAGVLPARVLFAFGQEFAQVEVLPRLQFADGVFGKHHHAQRADGLRDAVVDFRIDVVRAARQHDALAVVLLHVGERLEAFHLHVVLEDLVFGVCRLDRGFGFLAGHVGPCEFLDDAVDHEFVVGHVEVRAHVAHAFRAQFRHVRADDDRIVGDDRAVVVVVGVGHELLFVADAWVEDRLDALVEQPFDVAVHQFGRVADVFGGDRFDAGLEQLVVGAAGDHHLEAERGEQREPERVVLVHVEHARDADFAAGRLLVGEPAVGEAALVLVVVQVRPVGAFALGVAAAFAAVAGHVARAVLEGGDGELAVVLAQLAHVAFGGHRQVVEFVAGDDAGRGVFHAVDAHVLGVGVLRVVVQSVCDVGVVHARGQRGAVCAHQAGDVRSGHLAFGEQLEGAQHGVVEERAALHDDGVAEFAGIAQLDDLVQRVAHHGIAQARRDVLHRGAFLLRLLDGGVHEHGAAGAEVDRMRGVERGLREFLDRQSHGLRERLQERSAAGRACLVDCDGIDHAVGDREVFHVLTADVDDGGDAGRHHFGASVVGHGLHHTLVEVQTGGDQALAVAGRAGARDPCVLGKLLLDFLDDVDRRGQRAAFVGRV